MFTMSVPHPGFLLICKPKNTCKSKTTSCKPFSLCMQTFFSFQLLKRNSRNPHSDSSSNLPSHLTNLFLKESLEKEHSTDAGIKEKNCRWADCAKMITFYAYHSQNIMSAEGNMSLLYTFIF